MEEMEKRRVDMIVDDIVGATYHKYPTKGKK
jgi:hypothetical protein